MDELLPSSLYQRILVPVDGSAPSEQGLDEAIRLARLTGGRLRLLHLVDVMRYAADFSTGFAYVSEVVPMMREAGQHILAEGRARAAAGGVVADVVLPEVYAGALSSLVNDEAARWGADLIVLGTHGRHGVGRLLLGSDAEQIARTAQRPVLLVRATMRQAEAADHRASAAPAETAGDATLVSR